jgi:hypothetical protein
LQSPPDKSEKGESSEKAYVGAPHIHLWWDHMEIFDIKRGNNVKVEGENLRVLMDSVFGNCELVDGWYTSRYGAMQPIKAKMVSKKELAVEIFTEKIPESEVLDTMRKRNAFLEEATGFNSKERLKRLKQKVQGDTND